MVKKVDINEPINKTIIGKLEEVMKISVNRWAKEKPMGVTKEQFLNTPVPDPSVDLPCDRANPPIVRSFLRSTIFAENAWKFPNDKTNLQRYNLLKECVDLLGCDRASNYGLYPPLSSMEWHTNSNAPGTRQYYIFTLGESIFRFYDIENEKYIEDYHEKGWTIRNFRAEVEPLVWHTIWTEKPRFAFGFLWPD
jgi:hypothetical protein